MDLRTLHSDAMNLAEKAMIEHAQGKTAAARRHLAEALKKEERAARIAVETDAPEPTRSVLLKSAAHLAIDVGQLRLAEQLIGTALAGDPPEELAEELRRLFEEVGFHRHLDLQGIELHSNDVQLVLAGHAIAPGMAAAEEFTGRVETIKRLVQRTSESDRGIAYREQGGPRQDIERSLRLFVSTPRAASFAVSLKVASEKGQAEFQFAESTEVLDRVMDRLEMYDREDYASLRKAIPTQEYFDNFVELASTLAPDGEEVRLVGFTATRGGQERRLEMRRPSKGTEKAEAFVQSPEPRRLFGRVFFVNTKDQDNPVIKLETEEGTDLRLKAEGDLLQRAVTYAFKGSRVAVTGIQISKTVLKVSEFRAARRQKGTPKAERKPRQPRRG